MTITITAFERSPDGGKGLARDTRVRWALEEVGQPYEVRLVSFRAMKEPAHLALHPFGQIPTYEEGDLALFETGAIVFHIAERHAGLLPDDANARARAITWMFAALNTVEPPILELATARLLEGDKPWCAERLPLVEDRVRDRLEPAFRSPGRCRLARWRVQRGRPDDGVGAAQAESVGHSGRISEPGRLCRPRRSAARLQAGLRRSIGGLHRRPAARVAEARCENAFRPTSPKLKSVIPGRRERSDPPGWAQGPPEDRPPTDPGTQLRNALRGVFKGMRLGSG